jgi:N-acetylglutamate synthase-like GNAT family acetyltransferase
MQLRKASINDCQWVYKILEELRNPVEYNFDSFKEFFHQVITNDNVQLLILADENENIGYVTLNKFSMPRYIGYGFEMEEFIIHKKHRGKGYSYQLIEEVKKHILADKTIRKLIVKSNGVDSKPIYAKALNETDLVTFQMYLNKI